jgi:hypothetical protein
MMYNQLPESLHTKLKLLVAELQDLLVLAYCTGHDLAEEAVNEQYHDLAVAEVERPVAGSK